MHRECAHFSNGFCNLYKIQVDPNELICESFVPKNEGIQLIPQQQLKIPELSPSSRPIPQPSLSIGSRRRARRRARRRRGKGWISS
ncbi:MAG: hypothetical protein ACP5JF_06535 [Candidatus Methanodesulfokora sp.]|jgi:hypothetical protein